MQLLGIDLGTTNSVAAIANHVFPLCEEGTSTLPSVVAFLPTGKIHVGRTARRRRVIDFENTIHSSKRIIGRRWPDSAVANFRERYRMRLVEDENGSPSFDTRSGRFSATQIAAIVLEEILKGVASVPVEFGVQITVPATFSAGQRTATEQAAALAGLRDVRLVSESLATAYAYAAEPREFRRAMVYDLGGGTFDCAIIEWNGAQPRLLSHASDLFLGGDDIDQQLASWVASYVLEKHNWDLTNYTEIFDRLVARCEEAKIELSNADEAVIQLSQVDPECPAAAEGVAITRRNLARLCQNLVRRTFVTCEEALRSAGVHPPDIDAVLLAGGTTLMPVVQDSVAAYFGRRGLLEFDPTEVVARGASLGGEARSR